MGIHAVTPGSIVVAYDGSEHAERALRWAADRAVLENRELDVVHAVCAEKVTMTALGATDVGADLRSGLVGSARARVDAAVVGTGARHGRLVVRGHVVEGDARAAFVALSQDAHLIVVGSCPRGPLRRLAVGSVSVIISHRAACPVVVVCPEGAAMVPVGVSVGADGTGEPVDLV